MCTIVLHGDVRIPELVVDLESFREWAKSDEFPERGRYSFLGGELWVDLMPEQLFTHNSVKVEFSSVLHQMLKTSRHGRFFGDGTLVSNIDAKLSTEPDGTVVLFDSLNNGAVELVEAVSDGYIEIAGTPDIVLEIVSKSSVRKDTVVLRKLYWQAGIPEYWLVDVRGEALEFDILKYTRAGYTATRSRSGWLKSTVLDCSLQLTSAPDAAGNPDYTLQTR